MYRKIFFAIVILALMTFGLYQMPSSQQATASPIPAPSPITESPCCEICAACTKVEGLFSQHRMRVQWCENGVIKETCIHANVGYYGNSWIKDWEEDYIDDLTHCYIWLACTNSDVWFYAFWVNPTGETCADCPPSYTHVWVHEYETIAHSQSPTLAHGCSRPIVAFGCDQIDYQCLEGNEPFGAPVGQSCE